MNMKDAPANDRSQLQSWTKVKFDWKWENLETIVSQLVEVYPILRQYWDLHTFAGTGGLKDDDPHGGTRVTQLDHAMKAEYFLEFSELIRIVAVCLGQWARWLEGCSCHPDLSDECRTKLQRKRRLQDLGAPTGICPWAGRRGD